jgi:hypothetical protein
MLLSSKVSAGCVAEMEVYFEGLCFVGGLTRQIEVPRLDEGLELSYGAVLVVEEAMLLTIGMVRNNSCAQRLGDQMNVVLLFESLLHREYMIRNLSDGPVGIVDHAWVGFRKVALELNHLASSGDVSVLYSGLIAGWL